MGACWTGESSDALSRAERALFESVGLRVNDDFQIKNLPIYPEKGDCENYVHEVKVKAAREGLPKLVMMHGLGSGTAEYFLMIQHLRKYFTIYMIDTFGQGQSGRPNYQVRSDFESTIEYFTEAIHAWVKKSELANGEKFTLLGHSMGGMFAGWYALKNPQQIERLILLSPVGISYAPEWAQTANVVENMQGSCLAVRGANFTQNFFSESPVAHFDYFRIAGCCFGRRGIQSRFDNEQFDDILTEIQKQNLVTYFYQVKVRKKSSELALCKIFNPLYFTPVVLEDHLPALQDIPIAFVYGEFDFLSREGADRLVESGKIRGEVFQTSCSSHGMTLEAAEECTACILRFCFGEEQAMNYIEGYVRDK